MMNGLFGGLFDFDGDGKKNAFENAAEFSFLSDLESEERTELELSGLDPDELEYMDSDERRAALEDAGLNPDEYDF